MEQPRKSQFFMFLTFLEPHYQDNYGPNQQQYQQWDNHNNHNNWQDNNYYNNNQNHYPNRGYGYNLMNNRNQQSRWQ